jgi:hypothetical protein
MEHRRELMRWEDGGSKGLPRWVEMVVVLVGGSALISSLVCLFLAVYLWFNPNVF